MNPISWFGSLQLLPQKSASIITPKILVANDNSILGVQHEKVMLIAFFDHKGVLHHKHIPHDLLMNKHFDLQVTQCFCTPNHSEQHLK